MVASTLEQALGDPVACAELLDELFEATEGKNSYRTWVSFEAALVCLRAGEPARISRLLDRLTSTGMRRLTCSSFLHGRSPPRWRDRWWTLREGTRMRRSPGKSSAACMSAGRRCSDGDDDLHGLSQFGEAVMELEGARAIFSASVPDRSRPRSTAG